MMCALAAVHAGVCTCVSGIWLLVRNLCVLVGLAGRVLPTPCSPSGRQLPSFITLTCKHVYTIDTDVHVTATSSIHVLLNTRC